MSMLIKARNKSSPVRSMFVMGERRTGEYVLREMLKSSASLKNFSRSDFSIEERRIELDPGGFLAPNPGSEVFTFQGDRFKCYRARLDAMVIVLSKKRVERVPGYLRIGMAYNHLFLPECVLGDFVRRIARLSDEFATAECKGTPNAPWCEKHDERKVHESPVMGPATWTCESCEP